MPLTSTLHGSDSSTSQLKLPSVLKCVALTFPFATIGYYEHYFRWQAPNLDQVQSGGEGGAGGGATPLGSGASGTPRGPRQVLAIIICHYSAQPRPRQ